MPQDADDVTNADAESQELEREEPASGFIGRFAVIRRLASGAMGVVYSAYDEDLDRRVAVKVLAQRRVADRQRMLREAQALARLNHPNVVHVYEVGRHDEQIYIAMEFVQGVTLKAWLGEVARDRAEILDAFIQAGRGLQAAHDAQLVHRDFKPENVVVGADGRVRVLDFGIARVGQPAFEAVASLSPDAVELDKLTRTGQFMGTPAYMSPEQFQGLGVDAASDQFSFCIALYEALYGARPFNHASFGDLVTSVIEGDVGDSPSGGEVPSWLRQAVLRGLQPEREQRWPSMAALIEALAHDRSAQRRRRWQWAVAGVAMTGVAAAAVLVGDRGPAPCSGGSVALAQVWSDARSQAIAASAGSPQATQAWAAAARTVDRWGERWNAGFEEACQANRRGEQSDAVLDRRMRCLARRKLELDALLGVLEGSTDETLARSPEAVAAIAGPRHCADLDRLAQALPPAGNDDLQARVDARGVELAQARAMRAAGMLVEAGAEAARLEQEAEATGYEPLRAEALQLVARVRQMTSHPSDATPHFEDAYYAAVAGHHRALEAELAVELVANLGLNQRRYEDAEPWLRLARALIKRDGDPPIVLGALLTTIGGIREQQGRLEEAEAAILEGLELRLEHDAPAATAPAYNLLGLVHQRMGRHAEAEQDFREALELFIHYGGENHPMAAEGYNNLGVLYMHMDRYDDSEAAYLRALAIRREALGNDSPTVGRVLNNLGSVAQKRERLGDAHRWFTEALRNLEGALGPAHATLAIPLNNLGDIELQRGSPEKARPYYERALAIDELALGPDHRDLSYELLGLGRSHLEAGDAGSALPYLARALDLRDKGEFPPVDVGAARFHLGLALWATGDRNAARDAVRKAAGEATDRQSLRLAVQAWLAEHDDRAPP